MKNLEDVLEEENVVELKMENPLVTIKEVHLD